MPSAESLTTASVANLAGVHKDTLLRWLRTGLVKEPRRNRFGWRTFSPAEAQSVVAFAKTAEPVQAPRIAADQEARYLARLQGIDWDFQDAKTNYLTHGLHPYPAKFIPQIPNALIQELSSVGDTVGDIFCGSGTSLVEALLLKRNAVGIDANPLACLLTRAKTTPISLEDSEELLSLATRMRELGESLALSRDESLFSEAFVSSAWRPDFSRLDFWFTPFAIEELAEIRKGCLECKTVAARELALTAFSSIVVTVSKQDSDTRYVRREKNIGGGDTCKKFAKSLEQCVHAAVEFSEIVEPRFSCTVVSGSLLEGPMIPRLDLVVCSPPYPNAYSYHLYHMTRMVWLDMDQPKFKKEEIGSHRKYSSNGKNAATVETFRKEFADILKWLSGHLKPSGYACFVVGDSTLKGQRIDNTDLISKAGRSAGFSESMRFSRTMQSTKKAFNPAIGKIKGEEILILRNDGPAE